MTLLPARYGRYVGAVLLAVVGFSGTALATLPEWTTALGIDRIRIMNDGTILVVAIANSNHQCGSKTYTSSSSLSADVRSAMLAVLLANQARERKMQFNVTACNGTFATFTDIEDLT